MHIGIWEPHYSLLWLRPFLSSPTFTSQTPYSLTTIQPYLLAVVTRLTQHSLHACRSVRSLVFHIHRSRANLISHQHDQQHSQEAAKFLSLTVLASNRINWTRALLKYPRTEKPRLHGLYDEHLQALKHIHKLRIKQCLNEAFYHNLPRKELHRHVKALRDQFLEFADINNHEQRTLPCTEYLKRLDLPEHASNQSGSLQLPAPLLAGNSLDWSRDDDDQNLRVAA